MLQLVLTSTRSPLKDLLKLKARLPPELVDACNVLDTDEIQKMPEVPRVIAVLDNATAEDEATVRAAIDELSVKDMQVVSGVIVVTPLFDPGSHVLNAPIDDPDFYGTTAPDLASLDATIDDLTKKLQEIIEAKSTGIPFPETQYTGDHAKAYELLCELIGRAPMDDKGTVLYPSDAEKYLDHPRERVPKDAWNDVVSHLAREIRIFRLETDWFGDGGHLRNALRDQQFFDYSFVDFINDTYLTLPDDKEISLLMDVFMGTAIRAIATVAGPAMGAVASAIWTVSKAYLPNPKARIDAEIKAIKSEIATAFLSSIKTYEKADTTISTDWGLLDKFGTLVLCNELVWPRDLTPVREASAYAFQFCTMRSLLHFYSTTTGLLQTEVFGVVQQLRYSKNPRKRQWKNYHLYTHSEKHSKCGVTKNCYYDCYLGSSITTTLTTGPPQTIYVEAPKALQAKLFGDKTRSETDPQFNIEPGFLIYPKSKVRSGWSLPQVLDNSIL